MAQHKLRAELDNALRRVEFPNLNAFGEDPFGLDPSFLPRVAALPYQMYRRWWRVENEGIENLPDEPCIVVSNHTGQVPIDAMMIVIAALLDAKNPRLLRSMVDHFVGTLPFVGSFFERCGQVAGTPENAEYLLAHDYSLLVFPEGQRGINKPIHQAYQMAPFGHGFMRLALRAGVPIVPVAVIGAEESIPSAGNLKRLGKRLGLPTLPLIMTPLPLPTKCRLHWGEPMRFEGHADDADDRVEAKVQLVVARIQELIDRGLATREGIFS